MRKGLMRRFRGCGMVLALVTSSAGAQCPSGWMPGHGLPGVDGEVRAAVEWDPDGPGPQPAILVAGGYFELAGDVPAENVAAWDGSAWHSLGSEMNGAIAALAVYNGDLIAGGFFSVAGGTNANSIARWDGSAWQPLGSGVGYPNPNILGQVLSLTVYNGELIAGGEFVVAGGVSASNIARWNGSDWEALGSGVSGAYVLAVTAYNGELIAGGSFNTAGGVSASNIARWNGSAWQALGAGTNFEVQSLTVYDGELIAGGIFNTAGGVYAAHVARWDGAAWRSLGSGIGNPDPFTAQVLALAVYNGQLFAGGTFPSAGGVAASNIAAWDGVTWEPLGIGVDHWVMSMTVFDGELVAGGGMLTAGSTGVSGVARWDGSTWRSLGSGTNGNVDSFAIFNGELIAGGFLTSAEGVSAERIARWNGAAWQPLVGGGVNGSNEPFLPPWVSALAVDNGSLIVGGHFAAAGEIPARNIGRWDGSSWYALGSGIAGGDPFPFVAALAVYNGDLVAGGLFDSAGGVSAMNIARWDGSAWHSPGSGISGEPENTIVRALAVYDGKLIAGGRFTTAGGVAAQNIASWDGSTWQPLAGGGTYAIAALHLFQGDLIAGGSFTSVGGVSANNIARWDGSSWHPLGSGVTGPVRELTVHEGALIAGGLFLAADGVSVNGIARWDGSVWEAMGGGMSSGVYALASYESGVTAQLFAGGGFTTVDGEVSAHLARFGTLCAPGDLDEDGDVDSDDMSALLEGWGPCPACPPSCAGDVNGDCEIGIVDFLTLLTNWS